MAHRLQEWRSAWRALRAAARVGIRPHDPATLAATCLLAAWLPARRAARIEPSELLRGD